MNFIKENLVTINEIISSTTVDEKNIQTKDKDITLSKIANIFNNCYTSQIIRLQGYPINAMATDNTITVASSADGVNFFVTEFILDNNILYAEVMGNILFICKYKRSE